MKAKYASFSAPVPLGMVLTVALCACIQFLAGVLTGVYGLRWFAGAAVFFLANFTLAAMIPKPETLTAEGGGTPRKLRLLDWSLLCYFFIIGLGFNWVCAFLWFSRRYAFFSISVIAATCLIMAFYAVIALLVARLTGRNWRTALLVFAFGPFVLGASVLRLGLLR